jgi:hypothetical protein
VRAFADRFAIAKISDHLSWRSIRGQWSLSLLPLPRTEEALAHVLARVAEAQPSPFLGARSPSRTSHSTCQSPGMCRSSRCSTSCTNAPAHCFTST